MSIEEWIVAQVRKLLEAGYGQLTLKAEAGKITTVHHEKTMKPPPNLTYNRT